MTNVEACNQVEAEIEAALVALRADLEGATNEQNAASNPEAFTVARNRIEFITHQIAREEDRLGAAREATRNARTEAERIARAADVDALTASRAMRRDRARDLARKALDAYADLDRALRGLDDCQASDTADVSRLGALGVRVAPLVGVDALLLEVTNRNPGKVPTAYVGNDFGKPAIYRRAVGGVAAAVSELFAVEGASAERVATFRRHLGDEATSPDAPKAPASAPAPKPVQSETVRLWRQAADVEGVRYHVECWSVAGDGHEEFRADFSPAPLFADVLDSREVSLLHGLRATLLEVRGGGRYLTATDSPGLVSRALGAVRALVA
jgi:hypothetical protein